MAGISAPGRWRQEKQEPRPSSAIQSFRSARANDPDANSNTTTMAADQRQPSVCCQASSANTSALISVTLNASTSPKKALCLFPEHFPFWTWNSFPHIFAVIVLSRAPLLGSCELLRLPTLHT